MNQSPVVRVLPSWRPVALVVFALLAVGVIASGGFSRNPPPAAPTTPAYVAPDTSWVPAGFQVAADEPTVAWRFDSAVSCTYSDGSCWGIVAIAHRGCPSSLYIELSVMDSAGAAIGYTNDVAGAVGPMQQAKLTFDTFEKGASKARVTKVACY